MINKRGKISCIFIFPYGFTDGLEPSYISPYNIGTLQCSLLNKQGGKIIVQLQLEINYKSSSDE